MGGLIVQAVRTRVERFVAKTTVTRDHGSVTVDARAASNGPTRNELLEGGICVWTVRHYMAEARVVGNNVVAFERDADTSSTVRVWL